MTIISDSLLQRVEAWLTEAKKHPGMKEPTAMTLATSGADNQPTARMVLLKALDARGFSFFTNRESVKGKALIENAQAALLFYWMPLARQLRAEGRVEKVSSEDADTYFHSRSRESQLGAWASQQSRPLRDRDMLMERFREAEATYAGAEVPRPPYWGGWRVVPHYIEFWQEGAHRLHVREVFTRQSDGSWTQSLLNP